MSYLFITTIIITVLLFPFGGFLSAQKSCPPTKEGNPVEMQSSDQARKLWEKAIQAKGGREKLLQVRSLAESSTAEYLTHKGKRNVVTSHHLLVFPNKVWEWSDMRPDVFGLRIYMKNYESRMAYVITPDSEEESWIRPVSYSHWEKDESLFYTQLSLFMETKWVKPLPVSVHSEVINGKQVNVIRTEVNAVRTELQGKRFDFVLDKETNLPVRFIVYGMLNGTETPIVVTDLSDYVEIDGIKMPQKAAPEKGPTYTSKFQLNPEYNKEIFEKPTTINAGPDAWKKK